MANLGDDKEITALLVIDPYSDSISEGGKIGDRVKAVAGANKCVPNVWQVLNGGLRVSYAPHHR
jgi:ureidoacrylate peracid hydrolase